MLHLFGFSSWKSSDPKITATRTFLFENFSQKRPPKILGELFGVKIRSKWAIIPCFRCSKILGEAGKQEILQKMFRKFYISNRLPNGYFPKIDVGCPWVFLYLNCLSHGFFKTMTREIYLVLIEVSPRSNNKYNKIYINTLKCVPASTLNNTW